MTEFTRAIHTKEWWDGEMADANALLAPYATLTPDELTPERLHELFSVVIQEIGRVALITRALALEHPAPRRGRPPKQPPERVTHKWSADQTISVNPQTARIEFMGMALSPEQARALAQRLAFAASEVDGGIA